ncbi:WXG100 family type VII secretion target [Kitasatospora camelliae]|uniref:Outer membrane channel protein CpnT-like N-terminal domain-containing protein n=1 Tax=Kitasatospora camelliae TaxID=3156397 RepID=A0AAU8K079_9ACTN
MGVVLPDELAWILDLIGVDWPNVDEDDYREMADAVRQFAEEIDQHRNDLHQAVEQMAGENAGAALDAFQAHWGKVNGTHIHQLAEGCRLVGTVLDGVAVVITGAKVAAIVQLGILAAEVIAAQAAAPFTFGLSEAGAIGATQATRVIVRRLLKEAEEQIVDQLISMATGPIISALGSMAGELVLQLGEQALGMGDGVDLGRIGKAGEQGLKDGADDSLGQIGINRGTGATA